MTNDRLQKLRDLGANVRLGREGETALLFGSPRVPPADETRDDGSLDPEGPGDGDEPSGDQSSEFD